MYGGGTFTTMDKVLPGTYINFVSRLRAVLGDYDRGVVAFPIATGWGPQGVFEVKAEDFEAQAQKLFGYKADADQILPIREIFKHARKAYFYRTDADEGATAASCAIATAKYPGTVGNNIEIESIPFSDGYKLITYFNGDAVATTYAGDESSPQDNDYVTFDTSATFEDNDYELSGGTDTTATVSTYTAFLEAIETRAFNILGCPYTETATIVQLFTAFTKRMRDQEGVKFQLVCQTGAEQNHEGIIAIDASRYNAADRTPIIAWLAGAEADCRMNQSLTNMLYDGEADLSVFRPSKADLEYAIEEGEIALHDTGDEFRVLLDINRLITFTDDKGEVFSKNDVIRTIDMLATREAGIFNSRYIGMRNTAANRGALWSDIVKLHQDLQNLGALEEFTPAAITIAPGEQKGDVVITSEITVTTAMEKLYVTTYIS